MVSQLLDILSNIPGPWLALITAALGGTGVKLIEHVLGRGKAKADVATQIRDELRKDIKELQARVDELEEENDKWRRRAFKAEEELAIRNALIASHGCLNRGLEDILRADK